MWLFASHNRFCGCPLLPAVSLWNKTTFCVIACKCWRWLATSVFVFTKSFPEGVYWASLWTTNNFIVMKDELGTWASPHFCCLVCYHQSSKKKLSFFVSFIFKPSFGQPRSFIWVWPRLSVAIEPKSFLENKNLVTKMLSVEFCKGPLHTADLAVWRFFVTFWLVLEISEPLHRWSNKLQTSKRKKEILAQLVQTLVLLLHFTIVDLHDK